MSSSSSASKLAALRGLTSAKRIVARLTVDAPVHSVLLYGSEASGKSALADVIAQAWLCRHRTEEGACGECSVCLAFERGRAADFQRILPQPPSNLIGIPAMREPKPPQKPYEGIIPIKIFFRTPPLSAAHRVVVIEDADRLTSDAANALLKTLEEPHPHAKLILTTRSPGGVLPTILSRCLSVACELPHAAELAGTDDPVALILAAGAPAYAIDMKENPEPYRALHALAHRAVAAKPAEILALTEELLAIGKGFGDKEGARSGNATALRLLGVFVSRIAPERPEAVQEILEAHRRVLGNGNATLATDAMFAKMTLA